MAYDTENPKGKAALESGAIPAKKETIGEALKRAREEKGFKLAEAAGALCIRVQYLEALEENDFGSLPGAAYAAGFIRTYANFLGLDGGKMAETYRAENLPAAGYRDPQILDENIMIEDSAFSTVHLIIVAVLVLVGLGALYMATSEDYEAGPEPVAEETYAEEESVAVVASMLPPAPFDPVPEPVAEVEEEPPAPAPAPIIAPAAPIPAPILAPAPAEVAPFDPVPAPAPAVSALPVISLVPAPAVPEHEPREFGLADKNSARVVVRAKGKSWVILKRGFYKFDEEERRDVGTGERLFSATLEAGDTYYLPNGEGLFLSVGDVEALEITADGAAAAPIVPGARLKARTNIEVSPEKLKEGRAYIQGRAIE